MSGERSGRDLEPIVVEISDVLDLHSFRADEVGDVIRSYLDEACKLGLRTVRIVHGKGIGVQRRTVRTLLARDPRVVSFESAPEAAGGWGATCAVLDPESKHSP
ncbi:MAG: Smr/MutS family protein [Acidobacteriota bacterium]|jgi:dsDNA-specific endonuclease/ATPase MutS2